MLFKIYSLKLTAWSNWRTHFGAFYWTYSCFCLLESGLTLTCKFYYINNIFHTHDTGRFLREPWVFQPCGQFIFYFLGCSEILAKYTANAFRGLFGELRELLDVKLLCTFGNKLSSFFQQNRHLKSIGN